MSGTLIQWATQVWNPTSGCTKVSAGCLNCYIETTIPFRTTRRRFDQAGVGGTTDIQLHPGRLPKPFGWPAEQRIFVNSVSDLFHRAVPDDFVARVFAVMGLAAHQTFLLLTKRHGRMRALLNSVGFERAWHAATAELAELRQVRRLADRGVLTAKPLPVWPLPNVHLGVSVEDQRAAKLRIKHLLESPAAVRWASCEPLIGPVEHDLSGLDWIVIGGESGRRARRMAPEWAGELRQRAEQVGLPVFFKQAGTVLGAEWGCRDPKGGDPDEWPEPWPRDLPSAVPVGSGQLTR